MDGSTKTNRSWLKLALIACLVVLLGINFYLRTQQAKKTVEMNNRQTQKITELQNRIAELEAVATETEPAKPPKRYGMVIGVKPEKLDYYKELHANAWPGVNKKVHESNIQNYSIYLTQFDDGKWYLFTYFEYTGDDFEADMAKMAKDEEIVRWWKETDPCQIPLENRKEGEWWKSMEEVYRLK